MNARIRAQAAPWRSGVAFHMASADGKSEVTEITMGPVPEAGTISVPTFLLTMTDAQTLMDDLWHAGLRPTEGTGSAGALRAVERHLEDMRTLVFEGRGSKVVS